MEAAYEQCGGARPHDHLPGPTGSERKTCVNTVPYKVRKRYVNNRVVHNVSMLWDTAGMISLLFHFMSEMSMQNFTPIGPYLQLPITSTFCRYLHRTLLLHALPYLWVSEAAVWAALKTIASIRHAGLVILASVL